MENVYKTSDIYLASFVIAKGYSLVSTDKLVEPSKNKVKTFFTLKIDKTNLEKLKTEYYSCQNDNVNVSRYITALKNLKGVCFSQ